MITPKQNEKYLKDSSKCPFCESDNIIAGETELPDYGVVNQLIHCNTCNKYWWEIYELTRIEEEEP